tara:strand:+ start:606 stop:1079 length:474 start_codon:yes stop_codon:yes gene_type:complete
MKLTDVVKELVKEGKLSDFGDNNTPAALKKEKEIEGKKVDAMDSIEDLDLNTLGRNVTIKEYRYGPLNPNDEKGSKKFWEDKAEMWDTTVEHVKTSRCSNCVAFNQKAATLKKMEKAIGKEGKKIVKEANLGFCEFFWFKCAGARTCDAWVGEGPLK